MGNREFRDVVKPVLDEGGGDFIRVMPENARQSHDGTNFSNEIGVWNVNNTSVFQKVMLTATKYHQRRKALTEMVSAWLDERLGGKRVVPDTYAETFQTTKRYSDIWGERPKEAGRIRVCQVVHSYLSGVPGDEWRGKMYKHCQNLISADRECRAIIDIHPDAERIALLDFLTINQDRSARNWLASTPENNPYQCRFYAIDNGMAWFHEYPDSDDWKIGCVIDDVLLQTRPWEFISGVFTTSYAGRGLSSVLLPQLGAFDWRRFCENLNDSCDWLGLPPLAEDWRFTGLFRRLRWIRDNRRFPTPEEYRGWFIKGSELFTPPEIIASGGKIIWTKIEDRP